MFGIAGCSDHLLGTLAYCFRSAFQTLFQAGFSALARFSTQASFRRSCETGSALHWSWGYNTRGPRTICFARNGRVRRMRTVTEGLARRGSDCRWLFPNEFEERYRDALWAREIAETARAALLLHRKHHSFMTGVVRLIWGEASRRAK
jgi:hypothetical protein